MIKIIKLFSLSIMLITIVMIAFMYYINKFSWPYDHVVLLNYKTRSELLNDIAVITRNYVCFIDMNETKGFDVLEMVDDGKMSYDQIIINYKSDGEINSIDLMHVNRFLSSLSSITTLTRDNLNN